MSNVTLDKNWTHFGILVDTSGSMANMDTNELAQSATDMVKDQCKDGNKITVTIASFSDTFKMIGENIDGSIFNLSKDDIIPRGSTALIPAFGRLIRIVGNSLSEMSETRPGNIVFILLSDGEQTVDYLRNRIEDDSPFEGERGVEKLKELITEHQDVWKWKFFFLGTNFDSISVGRSFGISADTCINYNYSTEGAQEVMRTCSSGIGRVIDGRFDGFTNEERVASQNPNH